MLKARGNRKKVREKEAPAMVGVPRPGRQRGVYGISVAAELVGMGVQKLRSYEARGLLEPERTEGGTRRYSADDLDRLRRIGDLLDAGLNLAGIGMVLDLEAQNSELRAEKEEQPRRTTASSPANTPAKPTPRPPNPARRAAPAARSADGPAHPPP
jgi:MerR family transcriptional regulator, heat shock protein HspR